MASKITYDDKVSLTTSALPRANKCTDDDLNEIKQVVNDNADELDENTTNIEGLQGTILFENEDGVNTNITLNETAANFDYIEIFFAKDGSTDGYASTRIFSPDGKKANLNMSKGSANNTIIFYNSEFLISGTSITLDSGKSIAFINTGTVTGFSNTGELKIFKVVGYK
jgi:hypothetical protein